MLLACATFHLPTCCVADAQCNLTTHLKREPDEPEEGPPKRTSARPPKRRRREEDGSGEDEGAEPPEQEAAGEPAGIFPASLKVGTVS